MTALAWIFLAVAVWLVLGTMAGLVLGRVIRRRDQQTPRGPVPPPETRADAFSRPDPEWRVPVQERGSSAEK